jgi:hypothetical protein
VAYQCKSRISFESFNLPVEDVQRDDPCLVCVHFHTIYSQPLLPRHVFILSIRYRYQECDEAKDIQARRRTNLEQLVSDELLPCEGTGFGSDLFFAHETCGGERCENERAKKFKREGYVLLWNHNGEKGGDECQ